MGLLDNMMPQQQAPQGGGLLGSMQGMQGAAPQMPQQGMAPGGGQSGGLQMAMQLSQNPTPQMAQQIIRQLHQMSNPEAQQFEQILTQAMGNPQHLKQIADAVIQKLGGANA